VSWIPVTNKKDFREQAELLWGVETVLAYPIFKKPNFYQIKEANNLGSHIVDVLNRFSNFQNKYPWKMVTTIYLCNDFISRRICNIGEYEGSKVNYGMISLFIIPDKNKVVDKITLGEKHSVSPTVSSVFRHELGHHYYYTSIFGKGFRKAWARLCREVGKEQMKNKVSKWSCENYVESFAECFCCYTSELYKIGMLPERIESFMRSFFGNSA